MLTLEVAPSLQEKAYNVTTSTAVIAWTPLQRTALGIIDVTGYSVRLESERDKTRVRLVNITVSSVLFEDLKTFTNYCVSVEPVTVFTGLETDDCYNFTTEDDGKLACPPGESNLF